MNSTNPLCDGGAVFDFDTFANGVQSLISRAVTEGVTTALRSSNLTRPKPKDDEIIPLKDAAAALRICPATLVNWVKRGCPVAKKRGRRRYFRIGDVDAWLQETKGQDRTVDPLEARPAPMDAATKRALQRAGFALVRGGSSR